MKKNIKIYLVSLIFFTFIIFNTKNISFATDQLKIYKYDLFSQQHLEECYTVMDQNGAESIQGLNTLNLEAVYGDDKNLKYYWEVDEESKDIVTVHQTNEQDYKNNGKNTTGCIVRIIGINKGIGKVNLYVYDANDETNLKASTSVYVNVKNVDLSTERYDELYIDGNSKSLPSIGDVMSDLSNSQAQHPRIMTNMEELKKVEKYITYAVAKRKKVKNVANNELTNYEEYIFNNKNTFISDDNNIPDEYFDNLYREYREIFITTLNDIESTGKQYSYDEIVKNRKIKKY